MAAVEAQVVDPKQLPPIEEYEFSGDDVTRAKKSAFIQALRETATVYHSAQIARISRKTAYHWYQHDEQFAEAWEDSFQDAVDALETSVYQRALGVDGKADSLLAMFWLKAHRHKFRDKVTIDIDSLKDEIQQRIQQVSANPRQLLTPPANQQKEDGDK